MIDTMLKAWEQKSATQFAADNIKAPWERLGHLGEYAKSAVTGSEPAPGATPETPGGAGAAGGAPGSLKPQVPLEPRARPASLLLNRHLMWKFPKQPSKQASSRRRMGFSRSSSARVSKPSPPSRLHASRNRSRGWRYSMPHISHRSTLSCLLKHNQTAGSRSNSSTANRQTPHP